MDKVTTHTRSSELPIMCKRLAQRVKICLIVILMVFCISGLTAQLSPNGYEFDHDWLYYSDFSPTSNNGYVDNDHLQIQMSQNESEISPSTIQVNADSVLIRVCLDSSYPSGRYSMRFWISKKVNDHYEEQACIDKAIIYLGSVVSFRIPVAGFGSYAISFVLYDLRPHPMGSGSHIFDKVSTQQSVMINTNRDVLVKIRSSANVIKRPLLLVEGYDPVNDKSLCYYEGKLAEMDPALFGGIDVYFLDFNDATVDLRENSMVVLGAIKYINTLYQPSFLMEGVSVLGFSMGGVLSRYALAYAEEHNIPHDCVQLITYDSPHRGAHINTNLQDSLYDIYDSIENLDNVMDAVEAYSWALGLIPGILGTVVHNIANDTISPAQAKFLPLLRLFETPATKQLLRNNINSCESSCFAIGSTDYRDFFSEINYEDMLTHNPDNISEVLNYDANDPGNKPGYPYKQNSIRSIAIANGSIERSGDVLNAYNRICTLRFDLDLDVLPGAYLGIDIDEQGPDTQPGSTLGMQSWGNSVESYLERFYDPVFVPLISSLDLKPSGTNGYPDNQELVMSSYNDIIPHDSLGNVITDYQGTTDYLANHSFFDDVVISNDANLSHNAISEFVVGNAFSCVRDPFKRAIGKIKGTISNVDLSGVSMKVYVQDTGWILLDQDYCQLDANGRWAFAYTFLRDRDVKIVFEKPGYFPTVKYLDVTYDPDTYSVSHTDNIPVQLYPNNLQNIRVSSAGDGSFQTISDAVDHLLELAYSGQYHGEAVKIWVSPETYPESLDLRLLAEAGISNFTIEGVGEVILNDSNMGINCDFSDLTFGEAVYTIKNIKVIDCDTGILFKDRLAETSAQPYTPSMTLHIEDCEFEECGRDILDGTPSELISAGAIHFEGAGSIRNCNFMDNEMSGSVQASDQHFIAGAVYIRNNSTGAASLEGCEFIGNSGGLTGGLAITGTGEILVSNNYFEDNAFSPNCTISHSLNANSLSVYQAARTMVTRNVFQDHAGTAVGLVSHQYQQSVPCDTLRFVNNTICFDVEASGNAAMAMTFWIAGGASVQNILIRNNVFTCNEPNVCQISKYIGEQPLSLDHNIFHNVTPHQSMGFAINTDHPGEALYNFIEDPKLNSDYAPRWDIDAISPCIDAGVGSSDPDKTPPDIGAKQAIPHEHWGYTFTNQADQEKWYWVSYPVLNTVTENKLVASEYFKELLKVYLDESNIWDPIYLEEITWMENGEEIPSNIHWLDVDWTDNQTTHVVSSPQGYKVKLLPRSNPAFPSIVTLRESGFRTAPNTQFPIHGGVENWLGYFVNESVMPYDAFADIWEDITMIKTKSWCAFRSTGEGDYWGLRGKIGPLNYGDMVIVATNNDHVFRWALSDGVPPNYAATPEHFVYDEKPDYVPVYLTLPDDVMTDLKEIGLYLDGVCKGAVVIENNVEQLCAYLGIGEKLSDGVVEFVFYYDSAKAQHQERRTIRMDSSRFQAGYINGSSRYPYYELEISQEDMNNVVAPDLNLDQNYPNPFNPSTTIRYSIPQTGKVCLDIFNLKGQKVKTLSNGVQDSGVHSMVWNGTDAKGRSVASGVYFYRLTGPGINLSKRMLLMK